MLKLGVAFLAGIVVFTVVIEAANGKPGTVSTSLTGLGIERAGKRVLFRQNGTIALKGILVDAPSVHPQAEALVADELHHAASFIKSGILLLVPV